MHSTGMFLTVLEENKLLNWGELYVLVMYMNCRRNKIVGSFKIRENITMPLFEKFNTWLVWELVGLLLIGVNVVSLAYLDSLLTLEKKGKWFTLFSKKYVHT